MKGREKAKVQMIVLLMYSFRKVSWQPCSFTSRGSDFTSVRNLNFLQHVVSTYAGKDFKDHSKGRSKGFLDANLPIISFSTPKNL